MKRIPFDISKRPEIESGRYKVELADGNAVRILAWDLPGDYLIAAADWPKDYESEIRVETYNEKGWDGKGEFRQDLWLIDTQAPALTEWEKAVKEIILPAVVAATEDDGIRETAELIMREAEKEIGRRGYVISVKGFFREFA